MSSVDGLALLGAVLLAAVGGEAFLRAIIGAAGVLRVPQALVASTLAAFATSSPGLACFSWRIRAGLAVVALARA